MFPIAFLAEIGCEEEEGLADVALDCLGRQAQVADAASSACPRFNWE
jgi:hypothetical protein